MFSSARYEHRTLPRSATVDTIRTTKAGGRDSYRLIMQAYSSREQMERIQPNHTIEIIGLEVEPLLKMAEIYTSGDVLVSVTTHQWDSK